MSSGPANRIFKLPDELAWDEEELERRMKELAAAEARGEAGGLELSADEAIRRARQPSADRVEISR